MSKDLVLFEKRGHVAIITLNRPERMNAIDQPTRRRLYEIFEEFGRDRELCVAIMTGAGDKAFCAGADVKEMHTEGVINLYGSRARESGKTLTQPPIEKPFIVAVNGICAGMGMGYLVDSDIALCSENATFMDPHVSIGVVAPSQATGLVRRAPCQIIMRMAMTGRHERLSAQRAYEAGLVTEVVPPPRLMPRALEIADKVALNSPAALIGTKRAILESFEYGYSEAMENTSRHSDAHYAHPDVTEGPRAFAEKRPPRWTV